MPPVLPVVGPASRNRTAGKVTGRTTSFKESLDREIRRQEGIKLSAHAEKRLRQYNISLAPEDLVKIDRALQTAAAKGARDSLIIYGDIALIASVPNRTVVTAVEGRPAGEQVFTNIDSAVIIK